MNKIGYLALVALLASGCAPTPSGGSLSSASSEPLPPSTSSASAASVPSESSDPYDINASMSFDTYEPEDPELDFDYSQYESVGDEQKGHGRFWIWEIEPGVWRCGVARPTSGLLITYERLTAMYNLPCTLTRMREIVEDHFDRESPSQFIYCCSPYDKQLSLEDFENLDVTPVTDAYFYYRLGLLATWYNIQQWGDD